MSLKDHEWRSVYRSGDQNLLKEFYQPVLSSAIQYDRAVGFFSSEVLSMNLEGISSVVDNGGRMRLVIGHPLEKDEFLAVQSGHELNRIMTNLDEKLTRIIEESKEERVNKLELLAWLIAADKLEIKFALRRQGMYHEKIGIVRDNSEVIVFQGSANETVYALDEGFNAESIMVFLSWNQEVFSQYGIPCIEGFESLWSGEQKNTVTVDVPSSFYEKIVDSFELEEKPGTSFEESKNEVYEMFFNDSPKDMIPRIPETLGDREFRLYEHQIQSIRLWMANQSKGIMKLATGSGKTITSIYAATKVYQARMKNDLKFVLIVSVPYVELAKQWVDNLRAFNIRPIQCWANKKLWYDDLRQDVLSYSMNVIDFIPIVVVNRTLESDGFQELINKIDEDEIMVIGDECHNHGARKTNEAIPKAYYRMGLSATPFRSDEDEIDSPFPDVAKERILKYYGSVVAEYGLGDAINDDVLCEYDYYIVHVYLTELEQERFEDLSLEIGKLVAIQRSSGLTSSQRKRFTTLCGERSRLLGSASNKLKALEDIARDIPVNERKHSLFYCGEGSVDKAISESEYERIIFNVSDVLGSCGWMTSRFTSEESSVDRNNIMDSFINEDIDGLVSMKVLDEGVDVPVCDKAFILASTKNPRQYVQRRGRVLRKSSNKSKATIYDFVVLPLKGSVSSASKRLKISELERVDDFCLLATNRLEVEGLIERLEMRDE